MTVGESNVKLKIYPVEQSAQPETKNKIRPASKYLHTTLGASMIVVSLQNCYVSLMSSLVTLFCKYILNEACQLKSYLNRNLVNGCINTRWKRFPTELEATCDKSEMQK